MTCQLAAAENATSAALTPTAPQKSPEEIEAARARAIAIANAVYEETINRKPAAVVRRPMVQIPPPRRHHPLVPAVAAVVVCAITLGAYWVRTRGGESVLDGARAMMATRAAADVVTRGYRNVVGKENAAEPRAAVMRVRKSTRTEERAVGTTAKAARKPTALKGPAPNQLKRTTPARPRGTAAVPPVVQPPVREEDALSESAAISALPLATTVEPPVVNITPTAPATVTPAPEGPFFETRDVNEPPHVASNAAPALPNELKPRSINETVVVRALVSQSGRPSRVSLLRKSKTGPPLDEAVVAAVHQWTFSPALRNGEPVSCWFNFAVHVGGNN